MKLKKSFIKQVESCEEICSFFYDEKGIEIFQKKTTKDFLNILESENCLEDLLKYLESENIESNIIEIIKTTNNLKIRLNDFKEIFEIKDTNPQPIENIESERELEVLNEELDKSLKMFVKGFKNLIKTSKYSGKSDVVFLSVLNKNLNYLESFTKDLEKFEEISLEVLTEIGMPLHLKLKIVNNRKYRKLIKILLAAQII